MKKYFYSVLAASMLFACSQEEIVDVTKGEGQKMTFKVEIPNQTESRTVDGKTIGDGSTADKLIYAMYETGTDNPLIQGITDRKDDNSFKVEVPMAKDITYDLLFFAYDEDYQAFQLHETARLTNLKKLEFKSQQVPNVDGYDAFVGTKTTGITPSGTTTIELRRPFAQVNAATTLQDLENINILKTSVTNSQLVIKNVPKYYNVLEEEASIDETIEVTYIATPIMERDAQTGEAMLEYAKNEKITVDDKEYYYLTLAYVLAGGVEKESTHDATFEFFRPDGRTLSTLDITNLPIQRNYRTNVVGNLLTRLEDYTITIDDRFFEPAHVVPMDKYEVSTYNELQRAIDAAEENVPTTITLMNDIKDEDGDGVQDSRAEATYWINVPAAKNIILDLNGYTISQKKEQTGAYSMIQNYGTLTIKDSKGNGKIAYGDTGNGENYVSNTVGNSGTLTVESGLIENNSVAQVASNGYPHPIDNSGILTINGGTFTNNATYSSMRIWCTEDDNTIVTINGGTFNGSIDFQTPNKKANKGTLTINDGTFIADTYTNAAVRLLGFGADVDEMNAYIKGGNFNGEITLRNWSGDEFNSKVFSISGGTFNNDVTEFVADQCACIQIGENKYQVISGVSYDTNSQTYTVHSTEGFKNIFANFPKNGFVGQTIVLDTDVDLATVKTNGDSFAPIGSTGERDDRNRLICEPFKGTFDGQDHSIKGIYQSGWDMGYDYDNYGSIGLFSVLESATVKNVVIEGMEAQVERGDISFIAGSATGTCVFEKITIRNSTIGTFDNGNGGIIGWSGEGNYTFKNITLEPTVVIGGLWGSFDQSCGGIVGQAEPGATYNFEDVTISCRLDVYNDVTASWQYYLYRMSGMIIGRCAETTTINGANYPDLSKYNMTFTNVVVNYGDWMNYHYCHGPYGMKGNAGRVEPGFAYGGLDVNAANHGETCQGGEKHMQCIPFDQLIGGDQIGVRGLREVAGVTVNYPASYRREVSSAAALTEALGKGVSVILDSDIDFGSTQLAITGENQVVDLGGHALTTANNWGGISLKNGATIKNGTITHAGNTAAIKAFDGSSVENVTINATCSTADKTVTGIAVQQGANVESIKNVTINGVSQGIEVGYQATVGLIENAVVNELNNGTAKGIGLVINGGKVGKAKNCTFKGETYGITLHLKGVFNAGLELENCKVEGTTASIYAWDEKGISNTSGSLTLTYDAATTLTGPFVWDFEDECKSVVTLNQP